MSQNSTLTGSYVQDHDLTDLVPITVEDVSHFAELVFAIRNPSFGLPTAMMYGKYRYIISEMIRTTGDYRLKYLDPELVIDLKERYSELRSLPYQSTEWCRNLSVHTVKTKVVDFPAVSGAKTATSASSELIGFGSQINIDLDFKRHEVTAIESDHDRLGLCRIIAAEHEQMSVRTMLLLSDLSVPLQAVAGCSTVSQVETYASTSSLRRSFY